MITNQELQETFAGERIRILAPEIVPEGVTSPAARSILTEVGLPPGILNFILIDARIVADLPTLSAVFSRYGKSAPRHLADLYQIAQFGAGSASIDGSTGEVFLAVLDRPNLAPPLISSSLENFVKFLNEIERKRQLVEEGEEAERHTGALTRRLTEIDPGVMGELSPWHTVIEIAMDEARW
ncbi:SUKH-4 family immunity protein [Streptomyces niveus]|uniref:SUKH-4 family immunity protein n=1 Tax=Streptomyces niveus TaxID=193462 RepID=UPI00365B0A6C